MEITKKTISLKDFVNYLNYHGLIDKNSIQEESDRGFRNRLKLQKFVYLAQEKFGWNLGYNFSMYRYGPYSPGLADDYYDDNLSFEELDNNFLLPEGFLKNEFRDIVGNADEKWLETISTLMSLCYRFTNHDKLIDRVADMKIHINREFISQACDELLYYGLI